MTVGERIQVARKNAGMKQSELAEKLGVAVITVGQYERGKRQPRLEQLQHIANVLDVSVDYLLSGSYQISQTHLANGVHIYKNSSPFKITESIPDDFLDRDIQFLYQDNNLTIVADKSSTVTEEEWDAILRAYVPAGNQHNASIAEKKLPTPTDKQWQILVDRVKKVIKEHSWYESAYTEAVFFPHFVDAVKRLRDTSPDIFENAGISPEELNECIEALDDWSKVLTYILVRGGFSEEGAKKVATYAEDIFPRYRRQDALESTPATQEGTDTTPAEPPPESTGNG